MFSTVAASEKKSQSHAYLLRLILQTGLLALKRVILISCAVFRVQCQLTAFHFVSGPGCSETAEPIAGVSKHFNTIVISYSAEALQLTNRAVYPLFFRTIPHILQNG